MLLTTGLLLLTAVAQDHESPRPAHIAPEPGRLVGWGAFHNGADAGASIPQGKEAEGYVELATGSTVWIARHQDGTARVGGAGSLMESKVLRFDSKVVQVAAAANHWVLRLEDGTIRWRHPEGGLKLDANAAPSDAVWIKADRQCVIVLRANGEVVLLGNEGLYPPDKVAALAPHFREVKEIIPGIGLFVLRHQDDTFSEIQLSSLRARTARLQLPPLRHAAATSVVMALNEEGRPFAPFPSGRDVANAAPAGETYFRLASSGATFLGQQEDGAWSAWGITDSGRLGVITSERLNLPRLPSLLAFHINRNQGNGTGFVVGIEPGAHRRFEDLASAVPEIQAILKQKAADEKAAWADLETLEHRYEKALRKLLPSADANLTSEIENELASYRDLDRPSSPSPVLARLQATYRERAPALREAATHGEAAASQTMVTSLHRLQDTLTQAKKLETAVQVREAIELLAMLTPAADEAPSPAEKALRKFAPIAPGDRIFDQKDPLVPGELVVAGTWGDGHGSPLEISREVLRDRYVRTAASATYWIALQESGEFFCDGFENSSRTRRNAPRSIRRLAWIGAGHTSLGFLGVEPGGKLANWGKSTSVSNQIPEEWFKQSWKSLDGRTSSTTIHQLLGLRSDGTVEVAGANYEEGPEAWNPPPASERTGAASVFANAYYGGFLRQDETAVIWNAKGRVNLPDGFSQLHQVGLHFSNIIGLRKDGSLVTTNSTGGTGFVLPEGLDEVVELVAQGSYVLVLRADGNWHSIGAEGLMDFDELLPQMKGIRRLSIGSTGSHGFLIGIRP